MRSTKEITYKGIRKFRQNKIKLEMRLKDHMYNKKYRFKLYINSLTYIINKMKLSAKLKRM